MQFDERDWTVQKAIEERVQLEDITMWAQERELVKIPEMEVKPQQSLGHAFGHQVLKFAQSIIRP